METLLKVIVGSQAHGLATPESDTDYRSVYVLPTREILSLDHKYKGSTWLEGETEDNTAWEIGHFLHLAMQCNPTILEVFKSPIVGDSPFAQELRDLFPFIYSPQKAFDAFRGYAKNQQKKFLDKKDKRPHKYAAAHIRTLMHLIELLQTGTFQVNISEQYLAPFLKRVKAGDYVPGDVLNMTETLEAKAELCLKEALEKAYPTPEVRWAVVNEFLLKLRKAYWT